MSVERWYYFEPKVFAAGELSIAIRRIQENCFPAGAALHIAIFRTLADGTRQSLHQQSLEALSAICDLTSEDTSVMVDFGEQGMIGLRQRDARVLVGVAEDQFLRVVVEASDPELLRNIAEFLPNLGLTPAPEPSERAKTEMESGGDPQPSLLQAIEDLNEQIRHHHHRRSERDLSCFLSFPFHPPAMAYAQDVQRFLELVGVRVTTGQGYEPKPISEKVRDRLRQSTDVVVLIVVNGPPSMWTRDEIARAQQPGVYLIPLVEIGATFESGIFGDHEYIQFAEGHISDAFIRLLEGLQYVRRVLAVSMEAPEG